MYNNPLHYDCINNELTEDVSFFKNIIPEYGNEVLEIACGSGRLTIPLKKEGINITGLDLSDKMIELAKEKAKKEDLDIDFIVGDCRDFDLNKKFDVIFIPFNSICHIYKTEDVINFFSCVKKHLKEKGIFIISVFNPAMEYLTRKNDDLYKIYSYNDPYGQGPVEIWERTDYDNSTQISNLKWHFRFKKSGEEHIFPLNMKMYFPVELESILKMSGFEILEKYGDFDLSKFRKNSPFQIPIARKNEK